MVVFYIDLDDFIGDISGVLGETCFAKWYKNEEI